MVSGKTRTLSGVEVPVFYEKKSSEAMIPNAFGVIRVNKGRPAGRLSYFRKTILNTFLFSPADSRYKYCPDAAILPESSRPSQENE